MKTVTKKYATFMSFRNIAILVVVMGVLTFVFLTNIDYNVILVGWFGLISITSPGFFELNLASCQRT